MNFTFCCFVLPEPKIICCKWAAAKLISSAVPEVLIQCCLHSSNVCLDVPLTGEVVVKHCDKKIKSLECQLIRVESFTRGGDQPEVSSNRDKGVTGAVAYRNCTEIQTLEIVHSDPCHNLSIPVYMVLPRKFACPTMLTQRVQVEFQIKWLCILENGLTLSTTQPLVLWRSRLEEDGKTEGLLSPFSVPPSL